MARAGLNAGLNGFWGWLKRAFRNVRKYGFIGGIIVTIIDGVGGDQRAAEKIFPPHIEAMLDEWSSGSFKPVMEYLYQSFDSYNMGWFTTQEFEERYNLAMQQLSALQSYHQANAQGLSGDDQVVEYEKANAYEQGIIKIQQAYQELMGRSASYRFEKQTFDPRNITQVGPQTLSWSSIPVSDISSFTPVVRITNPTQSVQQSGGSEGPSSIGTIDKVDPSEGEATQTPPSTTDMGNSGGQMDAKSESLAKKSLIAIGLFATAVWIFKKKK